MRYIGNKTKLLDFIEKPLIENKIKNGIFFDIFAGTASVSKYFKRKGFQTISNDNMYYSYIFQKTYIENNKLDLKFSGLKNIICNPSLSNVIKYLNGLKGSEGFIFHNFCKVGSSHLSEPRNYFSSMNAKKIDAMREIVEDWKMANSISEIEYYVLLCSIIEKIPSISNISGTYGAYLKIDDPRMSKPFLIEIPSLIKNKHDNRSYNKNANELIDEICADVLYIDPPYNHRQYPANYHIWETISVWDRKITDTKTGLREYQNQKSDFCSKLKCVNAFEKLLNNANCKYIMFSYNSDGIMSLETIMDILSGRGKVTHYRKDYRRFKSHALVDSRQKLEEWLFFVNVK